MIIVLILLVMLTIGAIREGVIKTRRDNFVNDEIKRIKRARKGKR